MKFKWITNNNLEHLPFSKQIAKNRDCDNICKFKDLTEIPDISWIKDLDKAAHRILDFANRNKKIIIFGHDDPDGITSTYILIDFLKKTGANNVHYYIPNRFHEDYGFQKGFIDRIIDGKFDLAISVDGGVTSYDATKKIKESGCEVIITDHHMIPDKLPPAYAVINPKRIDSDFPDDSIAGVGVTFFLIMKMAQISNIKMSPNYIFWVATGTIADRVPLKDVNRALVKEALKKWNSFDDSFLTIVDPTFAEAPDSYAKMKFINNLISVIHNGRMPNGEHEALKMLLEEDSKKTIIYNKLLSQKTNFEKKLAEVDNFLKKLPQPEDIFYVFKDKKDEITYELLGYVASYIATENFIPTLMLKKKKDNWSCEARCTKGFNLVESFRFGQEFLIQFGGHAQAAGFTIKEENIPNFLEKFKEFVYTKKDEILENRKIIVDAITDCNKTELADFLNDSIENLYPFGQEFEYPNLLIKNLIYTDPMIAKNHILKNAYNMSLGKKYDLVVTYKHFSLKLIDFKEVNYA